MYWPCAKIKMSKEQRNRVRHSLVVNFYTPAAKAAFSNRLECVRSFLTPDGQPELDNNGLMVAMFDLVERCTSFSPGFLNQVLQQG